MTGTNKDEQAEWAEICSDFHGIRLEANRLGFRPRWQECARSTAGDSGSLAAWQRLVADIMQSDGVDTDFAGRHAETSRLAQDLRELLSEYPGKEYKCPSGLCSRRAASSSGVPPNCELFRTQMTSMKP